jgi:hypothetical protein
VTGPFIKKFRCFDDFKMQKGYFSRLKQVYVGLIMLAACSYSRFPCFLLASRVWEISSYIGLCFLSAGGLCQFYANFGGKRPIQRQPLLVQYKQQAKKSNNTPLRISMNDKNKQLTLLSQRKLALKARKTLFAL